MYMNDFIMYVKLHVLYHPVKASVLFNPLYSDLQRMWATGRRQWSVLAMSSHWEAPYSQHWEAPHMRGTRQGWHGQRSTHCVQRWQEQLVVLDLGTHSGCQLVHQGQELVALQPLCTLLQEIQAPYQLPFPHNYACSCKRYRLCTSYAFHTSAGFGHWKLLSVFVRPQAQN